MSEDLNHFEVKAKALVSEELGVDAKEIRLESNLIEDFGADPLAIVSLILTMEEAFNIEIPDNEAGKIKSFGDVLDYIRSKLDSGLVK